MCVCVCACTHARTQEQDYQRAYDRFKNKFLSPAHSPFSPTSPHIPGNENGAAPSTTPARQRLPQDQPQARPHPARRIPMETSGAGSTDIKVGATNSLSHTNKAEHMEVAGQASRALHVRAEGGGDVAASEADVQQQALAAGASVRGLGALRPGALLLCSSVLSLSFSFPLSLSLSLSLCVRVRVCVCVCVCVCVRERENTCVCARTHTRRTKNPCSRVHYTYSCVNAYSLTNFLSRWRVLSLSHELSHTRTLSLSLSHELSLSLARSLSV